MSDDLKFLLCKHGLYYRPGNMGYTGLKREAGRYRESDADPISGITAIHEDNAAEYSEACWKETIIADKDARITLLEQEVKRLADGLSDQHDEPWPGGTEGDRLHYWRDKCINAARELRRLAAIRGEREAPGSEKAEA